MLERAVQAVDISGKGDYDTALTLAIDEFDAAMEDYSFTKNRIILMSADMDSWISDEVMDLAVEKSIPVHTIGLGEGEFWTLRDISAYTGGTFTKVYTSDELTGKMRIFNERTEQFDTTDLDEDGLFDAIEERGIRLQTGEIIYTDPENPDTDYDGLLDGEEIDPAYQWEEFEDMETIWEHDAVGEYYFEMYSNPAMPDSDGDGLDDFLEYYNGTNAFLEDTDGDELSDKYEVDKGYDPLRGDSDGDFKSDYQEDKDGTNPFAYDESLFDFMLGMIQGDFIREPQGAVTVAGQVVGGFIPGMDFRDVWANLKHGDLSMAALSVAGLVPGIGDVAKSADTIIKFIAKNADNVDEVVKLLKIMRYFRALHSYEIPHFLL